MLINPYSTNSSSHVRAVYFDSPTNTYIKNTTANITPAFPTSSSYGLVSYWYQNVTQVTDLSTIFAVTNSIGQNVAWIGHQTFNSQLVLHVTLSADGSSQWMDFVGNTTLPAGEDWHHVIIEWDTSTGSVSYMIDGAAGAFSSSLTMGGSFAITYTGKTIQVGVNETINLCLYGALAEFFFYVPTAAINLSTVISSFIDVTDQAPMYLGVTGNVPFGDAPQVFLWGDKDLFVENLTHYSELPLVLDLSAEPTSTNIFQVVGTLYDASSDPFGGSGGAMV